MTLFAELKRRNVLRVAVGYVVTAWLIIQVAETILPQYGLEHHVRTVITVLAIGFLPAMILAWVLEWTPKGIRLDAGADAEVDSAVAVRASRRFDRIVIVILTVALAWFVYDKLVPSAPDVQYSIAVLPFSNDSPDAMPDYLADGLAGEVRELLANLPQLLVIERSSAFSFKGQDVAIPEIGRRLGVSHLLAGAVTQIGNGIRVRARLLNAAGEPLWSRAYAGTLNEIFAIQDEIASDVVEGLELDTPSSLPESRRTDPEALGLTLQAKQLWYSEIQDADVEAMIALLDEALEIDPNYTPAMVWRIYANWSAHQQGLISAQEQNEQWLKLAGRILAIEPENAYVHGMFAWEALYVDRALQAAASSLARALTSAPNNAEILRLAARFAVLIGRNDEGIAMINRSMAVDPVCSMCLYGASRILLHVGQLDEAERLRRRFIALHDQGYFILGVIKLLQGETEEALAIFRDDAQPYESTEEPAHDGLAMALHDLGRHEESDEHLAIYIEKYGNEDPRSVSKIYAWRNEKDQAFEWFHRADDMGSDGEGMLITNPLFRNLHGDPRWTAILEARGMTEQQLAALDFPVELLNRYRDD